MYFLQEIISNQSSLISLNKVCYFSETNTKYMVADYVKMQSKQMAIKKIKTLMTYEIKVLTNSTGQEEDTGN